MFDHLIKLTYLQKFSSGLSLNIFDIVSGAQITLQILPIVDRTVYFPFHMTLEVYPKVAKSFIVKMAMGKSEHFKPPFLFIPFANYIKGAKITWV